MKSWKACFAAMATRRISSRATSPGTMHQLMAATLETVIGDIQRIQDDARQQRVLESARSGR